MARAKLRLEGVTLCTVGSQDRVLAGRAMEICMAHCDFADAIFFSHEALAGSFRNVSIERTSSINAYNLFCIREMNGHIQSPFALMVEWDGYIIHPSAWTDEFLKYDYIGAKWKWHETHRVGNGGFSLRSKRLLEALADPQIVIVPDVGEDEIICRVNRPFLEAKYGIRFAPDEIADLFSYEYHRPAKPTFGFHSIFNFWREVSDNELYQMVRYIPPSAVGTTQCIELIMFYYESQRWTPLRAIYAVWRAQVGFAQVSEKMAERLSPASPAEFLAICESLIGVSPSPKGS